MLKQNMGISGALLLLAMLFSPAVWATKYTITVTGTVNNDQGYPQIFGSQAATLPFQIKAIVDTAIVPLVTVPANTIIANFGGAFPYDMQLITKSSITSMTVTVGTGAWTQNDLVPVNNLDPGQFGDILLFGPLVPGPAVGIFAVLINASGDLAVGQLACSGNGCIVLNTGGVAISGSDGGQGSVTVLSTVVALALATPQSDTSVLSASIAAATNIKKDWVKAAVLALTDITKLLDANRKPAAKLALQLFIDGVKIAQIVPPRQTTNLSGITAVQAAQYIAAAKAILAEI
jgi:hypothetical protein